MAKLFGFSIEDNEKTPPGVVSPVPAQQNGRVGTLCQFGVLWFLC